MSPKLKLIYVILFVFSSVSLVAFQNCTQQGPSDFGNLSSENGATNTTECTTTSTTPLLESLLTDSTFKFIVTDKCGTVLYYGTDIAIPQALSVQKEYRFYVVGVESVVTNASTLPVNDKWIGCATPANTDANDCTAVPFPTRVLQNSTADCAYSAQKPFRTLTCDPLWRVVVKGSQKILVNYNWFRDANNNPWLSPGLNIYVYIKPNDSTVASALRVIFQTTN